MRYFNYCCIGGRYDATIEIEMAIAIALFVFRHTNQILPLPPIRKEFVGGFVSTLFFSRDAIYLIFNLSPGIQKVK